MANKLTKTLIYSCGLFTFIPSVIFAASPHILTCPPVVTCQGYQGNGSCSDLPAGWEAQPGGIFTGNKVITFTFLHYAAATFTPDHGICFYYQKDSDSPSGYFDVGVQTSQPVIVDLDPSTQQWHDQYSNSPCTTSSEFCTVGGKIGTTNFKQIDPSWAPFK